MHLFFYSFTNNCVLVQKNHISQRQLQHGGVYWSSQYNTSDLIWFGIHRNLWIGRGINVFGPHFTLGKIQYLPLPVSLWVYIISKPINIFNSPWQIGRLRQVLAVIYIIIITVFVVIIILEIQKLQVILKFVADTISKMRQLLFYFFVSHPSLNSKRGKPAFSWGSTQKMYKEARMSTWYRGEVPRKKRE